VSFQRLATAAAAVAAAAAAAAAAANAADALVLLPEIFWLPPTLVVNQ